MNIRFIIAIAVLIILVGAIVAYLGARPGEDDERMQVVASFYPLAEFARQVGGEHAEVINLTPQGAEPHDFEPSPLDIIAVRQSDVFVYSGAGFEPWAERILPDLEGVAVINAGEGITLIGGDPEAQIEPGGEAPEGERFDPHYYLDPALAREVVQLIADNLSEVDPARKDDYGENATVYAQKLEGLDREFREGLADCAQMDIVTSHAAFAYLARRYGFGQVPIAGLAEEEPSPAELVRIVEFVRENQIRYVFFEKLVSPRLAETVAREAGAKTLVLDPIEGLTREEQEAGKDYIALMRENLISLRLALECV
ncbi:MAG: zinc ABC transporter substrate-binding protein [Thermoleophilia bacterium]|nr:zinc ABC transporter substrate-binding protein [Thermoleophilia bacterium]